MTKYFCDQCKAEFPQDDLKHVVVRVVMVGHDPDRQLRFEVCAGCYQAFLRAFDKITKKIKEPEDA